MPGIVLCCLTLALLLICPSWASPVTVRVDQSGGADYLTISQGVVAASAGDTVLVAPGTYSGPLNRRIEADGVTIVSQGGKDVTVVDCESSGFAFDVSWSSLTGFTIQDGYVSFSSFVQGVVQLHNGSITDCDFENSDGNGLYAYGDVTVSGCVFRNGSSYGAVLTGNGNHSMTDCAFDGNAKGLQVYEILIPSFRAQARGTYDVNGCLFTGNGDPAVWCHTVGPTVRGCVFSGNSGTLIHMEAPFHAHIQNCTIVDSDSERGGLLSFEHLSEWVNQCAVTNNVIAFNSCAELAQGAVDDCEFLDNCYLNPVAGSDTLPGGSSDGNIHTDPLFCGMYDGDYTLCADSPCLAENEPVGFSMGAYQDAAGCPPCFSAVQRTSWGAIKALYRGSAGR